MDEAMLKVRDAARRLQLNEETVRRWVRAGKLRGTRIGSTRAGYRIPASDVERLLSSGTPTSEVVTVGQAHG